MQMAANTCRRPMAWLASGGTSGQARPASMPAHHPLLSCVRVRWALALPSSSEAAELCAEPVGSTTEVSSPMQLRAARMVTTATSCRRSASPRKRP